MKDFCINLNIAPPIQLFSYLHKPTEGKPNYRKHIKCFLACSEPVGTEGQDRTTAKQIVPFEEPQGADNNLKPESHSSYPFMTIQESLEKELGPYPSKRDSKEGDRTICADMTKLISADSWVLSLKRRVYPKPLRDPKAEQDFEMLVTLLANKTLIYIEEPEKFAKEPTPIMGAWKTVAEECGRAGCVPLPRHPEGSEQLSNKEVCEQMVGPFDRYLDQDGACVRIVAWARFQLCDRKLSDVFWNNNSEDNLKVAMAMFESAQNKSLSKFYKAVDAGSVNLCGMSEQHRKKSKLTLQQFMFAYAFWAFVKGYKYTLSLTNEHLYAVHWLRELAITTDASRVSIDEKCMSYMAPWGPLITDILKDAKHYETTAIADGILSLRELTIDRWGNVQSYGELVELLEKGVEQFMSKVSVVSESPSDPIKIGGKIFKCTDTATGKLPLIMRSIIEGDKFVVKKVIRKFPKKQQVKLLKKSADEYSNLIRR